MISGLYRGSLHAQFYTCTQLLLIGYMYSGIACHVEGR